jgi:DNA replication protein DnaC
MLAEAEKITQRGAADNADHLPFLLQLVVLELIERGRKVRFFRVTELVTLLLEAKEERHLLRLRQQLA